MQRFMAPWSAIVFLIGMVLGCAPVLASVEVTSFTVNERDGQATATVSISSSDGAGWLLDYSTVDGSASDENSDDDYKSANGTLTFVPGDTEEDVVIDIVQDAKIEGLENFGLQAFNLRRPSGVVGFAVPALATGTIGIEDDDTSLTVNINFDGGGETQADVTLSCDSGDVDLTGSTSNSKQADEGDGGTASFDVINYLDPLNCEAWQTNPPPAGYTDTTGGDCDLGFNLSSPVCLIENTLNSATINVSKSFIYDVDEVVEVNLDCTSGDINGSGSSSASEMIDKDNPALFTIEGFSTAADASGNDTDCTVTEMPMEGFVAVYTASGDTTSSDDDEDDPGCHFTGLGPDDANSCAISNVSVPIARDNSYTTNEDTQLAGNVITDDTGDGADIDVDGDGLSINDNTDVSHGTLVLNLDGSFTYDPDEDYCGPDSFTYDVVDNSPPAGPLPPSNTATVSITVTCVNDPPEVASVNASAQTSDYSDFIGTVTITVVDVDDASTTLVESEEPPLSAAGLALTSTGCTAVGLGSSCTWTYDGQVLDPGDNVYDIVFTPSDGDGTGVTGTHTLTVEPEDATVDLDPDNEVAMPVEEEGGVSGPFTLLFSAWETDDPDNPHDGTATYGDLNKAEGFMTLAPVGAGSPVAGVCTKLLPLPIYPAQGYLQLLMFSCAFNDVPVNTYEVIAQVDGLTDTTRYYAGSDDDVFTVYDPSLGFTTGGGWFYWPGTCEEIEVGVCDEEGYPGDRTNVGFNMKYNRKGKSLQGSLLLMRHTMTGETYKVKSNALNGLSVGEGTDGSGNYGWAAFDGKATYRAPGMDTEGNYSFLTYVEDHDEQGCNQDPSDEFWIRVEDKDGNVVLEVNGPNSDPAGPDSAIDGDDEPIQCGNIIVPHSAKGKGRGKQ